VNTFRRSPGVLRLRSRSSPVIGGAAILLCLGGCTSAVKQVARHQNSYDYRIERYLERCVVTTPPSECIEAYTELHVYEKHLHEAAKALKNGGGMPLQLDALKVDAAKLKKRAVTK